MSAAAGDRRADRDGAAGARPGALPTDLVLSPFDAAVPAMLDAARVADAGGFEALWTFDHFAGGMLAKRWSRDPFVVLGAIASVTHRIGLGVLVANMVNRHPAQLASAVSSLQSLAPGRVRCGLGTGAAPGTRFAGEQEGIGRRPAPAAERRRQLVETIAALRLLWSGGGDLDGEHVTLDGVAGVVEPAPCPPIVVGAAAERTVRLAAEHADGVNIRRSVRLADLVATARSAAAGRPFEISVFDDLNPGHPLGGDPAPLLALGVDRRTLVVAPPYPLDAIRRIGSALAADPRSVHCP